MKTSGKYTYRLLIFMIIVFSFQSLYSQQSKRTRRVSDDPGGVIKAQLTAAVQNQFGQDYRVAFRMLDSAIARNESTHEGGELEDPYNTLKGYIWFVADKKPIDDDEHGIVGMYKDGQIIWHSEPVFKGESYGIYSIKEINNDGKVELLVEWTPGAQMIMVSHLWIISWDGTTGTIINQVDSTSGNTTIHAEGSMFELIVNDTTSAMLIRAYWPEKEDFSKWFPNIQISTLPFVTYSWNGTLYGLWTSTQQIPGDAYLPANKLTISVNCSLSKQNDSLLYHYDIYNIQTSLQSISVFALKGLSDGFINTIQSTWDYCGYSPLYFLAQWTTHNFGRKGSIQPGERFTLDIKSTVLPSIINYYAQGVHSLPVVNPLNLDSSIVISFLSDLFTNSYVGSTIGPSNPSVPFIPLTFLDTLTNYTTQSHSLGWIKDSLTAVKYLGYFSTAKTKILQNDTAAAKSTLRQVLTDVDIDSTSNTTSEAYALLRFNTEYLIPRIVPLDTLRVPSQYATIQVAINAADSGKTILVSAGTYNELDSINNKKSLKLVTADTNVVMQGVSISNSSGITVKGFKINASGTSQDAVQIAGAQNTNITIEANDIQNSSRNGITIGQNNDTVNIVNNVIANNDQNGINFATGATGTQYIVNNTIVKNGKCGIEAVGPQKLLIVNNIIIYDTLAGRSGERLVSGAGITYIMQKNNLILRRQNGVLQSNYRLMPGSIAIDKGTTNFAPLPTKDKNGNPRVSGLKIDVGAYEYQQ